MGGFAFVFGADDMPSCDLYLSGASPDAAGVLEGAFKGAGVYFTVDSLSRNSRKEGSSLLYASELGSLELEPQNHGIVMGVTLIVSENCCLDGSHLLVSSKMEVVTELPRFCRRNPYRCCINSKTTAYNRSLHD